MESQPELLMKDIQVGDLIAFSPRITILVTQVRNYKEICSIEFWHLEHNHHTGLSTVGYANFQKGAKLISRVSDPL